MTLALTAAAGANAADLGPGVYITDTKAAGYDILLTIRVEQAAPSSPDGAAMLGQALDGRFRTYICESGSYKGVARNAGYVAATFVDSEGTALHQVSFAPASCAEYSGNRNPVVGLASPYNLLPRAQSVLGPILASAIFQGGGTYLGTRNEKPATLVALVQIKDPSSDAARTLAASASQTFCQNVAARRMLQLGLDVEMDVSGTDGALIGRLPLQLSQCLAQALPAEPVP